LKDIADLLGRIFIGLLFVYQALDAILFFQKNVDTMAQYGINWYNETLMLFTIILLLLGSFLVLIGYKASLGAFLLLLYWIPYTLIVFSFWNDPDIIKAETSRQFMYNLALSGGLLVLLANGAGKYSIKRLLFVMRLPK
jgi:putative oxidoreductase